MKMSRSDKDRKREPMVRWIMVSVSCACDSPDKQNLYMSKNGLCCKRCGRPLGLISYRESASPEDVDKTTKRKNGSGTSPTTVKYFTERLSAAESQLSCKEKQYDELINAYDSLNDAYDQVSNRLQILQKEHEQYKADAEKKDADMENELNSWKKSFELLSEQYAHCKQSNAEILSELTFANTVNDRLASIDIRNLTAQFLEYMSGIYNASFDITDAGRLSQMIQARTDKVIMTAESSGVKISRHERESELGDGRMDIDIVTTESPKLDGKVARCRGFGCSFRNDAVNEIPEKVSVWRCLPKTKDLSPEEPVAETIPETKDTEEQHNEQTVNNEETCLN